MAEGAPGADVFVSHAREDLPFVRRLTEALQARGREVWDDLEDIIPSAEWEKEVRTGITEADAIVAIIIPDSVASVRCRTELDYAMEQSKRLVPVLVRPIPDDSIPPELVKPHWLRLLDDTDFNAGVDQLIETLDTDIDRVHMHTRLLGRTRQWDSSGSDRSLLLRGSELK